MEAMIDPTNSTVLLFLYFFSLFFCVLVASPRTSLGSINLNRSQAFVPIEKKRIIRKCTSVICNVKPKKKMLNSYLRNA